ncbi:MAG: nucleotidyltransferase family protein [Actinomycetota bacterium]|nr:nucleotidyltransferase family protein [Actinomycetota bacterium]
MTGVAGLLLAAGGGSRFGMPKALAPFRDRLLVEHAAATLADGGCDPVIVVLGAAADEVRARADLPFLVVDNPDWATGVGSSLRVGLAALSGMTALRGATAVIVLPVDTPGITPEAIRRLAEMATSDALARATYGTEAGHPVLIGRTHWAGVAAAADADEGGRAYLARHPVALVPCDDIADGTDADHRSELTRFEET